MRVMLLPSIRCPKCLAASNFFIGNTQAATSDTPSLRLCTQARGHRLGFDTPGLRPGTQPMGVSRFRWLSNHAYRLRAILSWVYRSRAISALARAVTGFLHRAITPACRLLLVATVTCAIGSNSLIAEELKIDTGEVYVPDFKIPGEVVVTGILEFEDNWARVNLGSKFYEKLKIKFVMGERELGLASIAPTAVDKELKWSIKLSPKNLPLDAAKSIKEKKFKLQVFYEETVVVEVGK